MKILYIAAATLALPVSLAAQNPPAAPAAPPADPITTSFRTRTMALQRNLAQAFDSIPESKFGYKPTPAQLSIGYIAQHLATDNYIFCNAFGSMKGTRAAEDTSTADSRKAVRKRSNRAVVVIYEDASLDQGCDVRSRWQCIVPSNR